jgi:hypothetical protein
VAHIFLVNDDFEIHDIGTYFEPRVTATNSSTDIPLPGCGLGQDPRPVPLNFGDSGHQPLVFRLYDGQTLDVGFLRIFVSTAYVDLSSISQESPMQRFEDRVSPWPSEKDEHSRGSMARRVRDFDQESGSWDVITFPLIQRPV